MWSIVCQKANYIIWKEFSANLFCRDRNMKLNEFEPTMQALYQKMKSDNYSDTVIENTNWILNHFRKHCILNQIGVITIPVLAEFLQKKYDIDYYNPTTRMQTVLRRPLLILMEFYESGNYCKTHQRGSTTEIPLIYKDFFLKYRDFVNGMDIVIESKERKLWVMTNYLHYLEENGVLRTIDIRINDAHNYLNSLTDFAPATKRTIATILRESYDWMYRGRIINFSGRQAFPLIRKDPRNKLLSCYSKEEIEDILSCINTSTTSGKTYFLIISLIAHLGIRVGDVINLKFSDINWNNNTINIIQKKTDRLLTIPLVDEVKYPLIDYIKNVRHDSEDKEYVLITTYAPHTRYHNTASIGKIITKCMKTAGIQYEGRHHGPHALRHSLATNLMNENVPLSAIANIMGHSSTRSTEIYLTVDETNLRELSLEVPDVL